MDSETRTLITTLTAKIRDLRAGAQDQGEEGEELLKFVAEAENGLSSLSKAFQVAQNKGIHPRPSAEFESEEGGTIQYGSPAPRGNKK